MIVNPRLLNYRLIISSLIVAIAVLTVFSVSNYVSIEQKTQSLENENILVESELSQMISRYDELISNNDSLSSQLEGANQNLNIALDSLRLLDGYLSVVKKKNSKVNQLALENKNLNASVEDLKSTNAELQEEVNTINEALTLKQEENIELNKLNASYKSTIDKASALKVVSFKVLTYNTVLGRKTETVRASKTNVIDVCVTLSNNVLTTPGRKDVYIQIVSPDNQIFADKGEVRFEDNALNYSARTSFFYQNKSVDVCTAIGANVKEQPLKEGTYLINVFSNGIKVGSTELELN